MRAAMLALLFLCSSVRAGEDAELARFEIRATRVSVEAPEARRDGSERFAVAARVSILQSAPDPFARFQVKAGVKAASATCGPQGDRIFEDGFE